MNTVTRTVLVFFGSLLALVLLMTLTTLFQPAKPRSSPAAQQMVNTSTASASIVVGGINTHQSEQIVSVVVALAKAEVTKLTQEPASRIVVVSSEATEWPSTALGCGKEGYLYSQVVTPGYKVILQTQTEAFEYHSDSGENMVLCKTSQL